jgi:prolyl-tRNA editing enzyme YbaK/EbsC (Cys-tRNA(Pro) deacylase)
VITFAGRSASRLTTRTSAQVEISSLEQLRDQAALVVVVVDHERQRVDHVVEVAGELGREVAETQREAALAVVALDHGVQRQCLLARLGVDGELELHAHREQRIRVDAHAAASQVASDEHARSLVLEHRVEVALELFELGLRLDLGRVRASGIGSAANVRRRKPALQRAA